MKDLLLNKPGQLGEIKCGAKSKILGQIMSTNANINEEINDRLNKANIAWGTIQK